MPSRKRIKTKYPGVYYVLPPDGNKTFYILYRVRDADGKSRKVEEKVGDVRRNDMSPAKASTVRARRLCKDEPSNNEKREALKEREFWTIDRLWREYRLSQGRTADKPFYANRLSADADYFAYAKHVKPVFGKRHSSQIGSLDLARFRNEKLKDFKPQTVKHCMALLVRLVRFGARHKLAPLFDFQVEYPRFDNKVTNPLGAPQLKALLKTLAEYEDPYARVWVLTALLTGLRRGSVLRLKKSDLDYERSLIYLERPKGAPVGKVEAIPFPRVLQPALKGLPANGSEYVFPGKDGGFMFDGKWHWNKIRKLAKLESFRFHDLRHTFATLVASSGQVDIRELQRLLLHKSLDMTMRYSHLLDTRLQTASNAASNVIVDLAKSDDGSPMPVFTVVSHKGAKKTAEIAATKNAKKTSRRRKRRG